jgi:hypothetical protein
MQMPELDRWWLRRVAGSRQNSDEYRIVKVDKDVKCARPTTPGNGQRICAIGLRRRAAANDVTLKHFVSA